MRPVYDSHMGQGLNSQVTLYMYYDTKALSPTPYVHTQPQENGYLGRQDPSLILKENSQSLITGHVADVYSFG